MYANSYIYTRVRDIVSQSFQVEKIQVDEKKKKLHNNNQSHAVRTDRIDKKKISQFLTI